MYASTDIIKNLIKQHYEALAAKTAEQFADSPCKGIETITRQTTQRLDEERIVNQFETIAHYYVNKQ